MRVYAPTPCAFVRMSTAATQRPSRRSARRTDACGTRLFRESRTTTVTPSRFPRDEYVIRPTRAPATTFTVARATNAPDRALIVALPGLPAVNVVDDPDVGESRPFDAAHEGDGAIMLPNPSVPDAREHARRAGRQRCSRRCHGELRESTGFHRYDLLCAGPAGRACGNRRSAGLGVAVVERRVRRSGGDLDVECARPRPGRTVREAALR